MRRAKRQAPIGAALAMQRAAAREGFDWRRLRDLWLKLAEEIDELRAARDAAERREELGDLLFMLVNLARHLEVDPTRALREANRKFTRRYAFVRRHLDALPALGDRRRLDAMEALWQEAKRKERRAR
jgi:uncharacterized protein YabN with tetrapyrrole methylase and pyrophosphatase domain